MDRSEFRIGVEFWSFGRQWRCTDIGSRVVVAIRVDSAEKATGKDGFVTITHLTREQAEAEGWFNGPPYAVVEHVFDEDDIEGCTLEPDDDDAVDGVDEGIRPDQLTTENDL